MNASIKRALLLCVLVVVIVTGVMFLFRMGPLQQVDNGPRVSKRLPAVGGGFGFDVETTLVLEGQESSRRVDERYRIARPAPDRLRIERLERRIQGPDTTVAGAAGEAVVTRIDGNRYRVERGKVVDFAGTATGGPLQAVKEGPGSSTYLVNQLVGGRPFLDGPVRRDYGETTVLRNDTQTVVLSADGFLRRAEGAPLAIHNRYSPYYRVTYSETVTGVRSIDTPSSVNTRVSDDVLKVARGETGSRLPNHRFQTIDSDTIRLHQVSGPKLINQWATWCPPCTEEIPALNRIHARFGERVQLIGITNEDPSTVGEFLADQPIDYRVFLRSTPTPVPYRRFRTLPFTILVDGDNRIQSIIHGARTEEEWENLVRQHLLDG